MLTYNQFRSKVKGRGLSNSQRSIFWDQYKSGIIDLELNIKKLLPKPIEQLKSNVEKLDYLSNAPPEIAQKVILKLPIHDITSICTTNNFFKNKVCTTLFWQQWINEKWGKSFVSLDEGIVWSSEHGYSKILKIILKNPEVNPSIRNNIALRLALENNHTKVIKVLFNAAYVNNFKQSTRFISPGVNRDMSIKLASRRGNLEIVKMLLSTSLRSIVNPSIEHNFPLRAAARNGHLEVVKLLLKDNRVDPSAKNNYAIRIAAKNGHLLVVELLLNDNRVNPNDREWSALRKASTFGHLSTVKALLESGKMNLDNNYNDSYHNSSKNGHYEIAKLLLKTGKIDPNYVYIGDGKFNPIYSTMKMSRGVYLDYH